MTPTATRVPPPPAHGLTYHGGDGSDKLVGVNAGGIWTISSPNGGVVSGVAPFDSVENLTGGAGVDSFAFTGGATLSGSLNGGGSGDWLDYSGYPGNVTVDLSNPNAIVATAISGTVSNIQNVMGSTLIGTAYTSTLTGNSLGNILVGGNGNDTITGGSGYSVLIGGAGNDSVSGGSAQDILIAGSVNFQHNIEDALGAIEGVWRTDQDPLYKVYLIDQGVTGSQGTYKLIANDTVLQDDGTATPTLTTTTDNNNLYENLLVGSSSSTFVWHFDVEGAGRDHYHPGNQTTSGAEN